ncbi:MAG: DUF4854 domain-containing protein [Lactococcus sp.]|nr:DUF4854 domain-containing protein [Lactococcus sp.]
MKKKLLMLVFAATLLVGLSACSSKTKTESSQSSSSSEKSEVVKKSSESSAAKSGKSAQFDLMIEAAQSQIPQLKQQFGDTYSDMTITRGEGDTIVYTYTYAQDPGVAIDAAALKPTLVKGLKPVIDSTKGIFPDVKIQIIYLKPDKTELVNLMITQEDTNAIG